MTAAANTKRREALGFTVAKKTPLEEMIEFYDIRKLSIKTEWLFLIAGTTIAAGLGFLINEVITANLINTALHKNLGTGAYFLIYTFVYSTIWAIKSQTPLSLIIFCSTGFVAGLIPLLGLFGVGGMWGYYAAQTAINLHIPAGVIAWASLSIVMMCSIPLANPLQKLALIIWQMLQPVYEPQTTKPTINKTKPAQPQNNTIIEALKNLGIQGTQTDYEDQGMYIKHLIRLPKNQRLSQVTKDAFVTDMAAQTGIDDLKIHAEEKAINTIRISYPNKNYMKI